jgi:uncharacterized protein (TIGR03000 family)
MHPPGTADLPPFPRPQYLKSAAPPSSALTPPLPPGPTPPAAPLPGDGGSDKPKKDEPKKEKLRLHDDRAAPATVVLSVPARAMVTVEGHALRSTGRERTFRTPALAPAESYVYTVKVTVVLDGREEVETREVTVTPGETTRVSFDKLFAKAERAAARSVARPGR